MSKTIYTTPIGKAVFCALDQPVAYTAVGASEATGTPKFKIELAFDDKAEETGAFETELLKMGLSLKTKISKKTGVKSANLTLASKNQPLVFDQAGLVDQLPRLWASIDNISAQAKFTTYQTKQGRTVAELQAVYLISVQEGELTKNKGNDQSEVRQQILQNYMQMKNKKQQGTQVSAGV